MLTPFFGTFARAIQPAGGAYDASGIGAALWSPPGVPVVEPERAEDFGQALADACGEDADRVFQVAGMIDEHAPAGSYYYLHFLGVRAERQGQGIGSALLREVLTHCDARGIPAYLDATSEDNRRLYERHGFVVREAYSPRGCPPLFAMWREPRS
jgi:ribosomal protein S18 acetylase RimI-like enzyme